MIGFLLFQVGLNVTIQRECYHHAFPTTPLLEKTCRMDCVFRQHGTTEEKLCWTKLMRCKVLSMLESPFETTVVVDADVWPMPSSDEGAFRRSIAQIIQKQEFSATMDTWSDGGYVDSVSFNGGFLILKRSDAMKAFLTLVLEFLDANLGSHEQYAYKHILGGGYSNISWGYLHHTWSCRSVKVGKCKFVHSHAITSCPEDPALAGQSTRR